MYSSTICSKTQAFETFSLRFLDKTEFLLEYKIIAIYIDIIIRHQRSSPCRENLPKAMKNLHNPTYNIREVSPSTTKVEVLCYLYTQYASNEHITSPFVIELSFHQTRKTVVFPILLLMTLS